MNKCNWHLCENEAVKKYCSVQCKNKAAVDRFRKNLKLKAVEYMGGSCAICGYDKYVGALEFHHIDPSEKDFAIGANGHTRKWEVIKEELDKCVMLCGNCHSEVHAGVTEIPL